MLKIHSVPFTTPLKRKEIIRKICSRLSQVKIEAKVIGDQLFCRASVIMGAVGHSTPMIFESLGANHPYFFVYFYNSSINFKKREMKNVKTLLFYGEK